ncbi:uncharacterized protein JCM15063_005356 [Sporobolomyces koalae]|uniref:uncharacterized protein n=1 Tax=Sporobolomyces koalae TaxID=500713 RepID=UPI00317B367D
MKDFPPLLGYVPREYIASGGQSQIYRALHATTLSFAALKVVPLPVHEQAQLDAKAKQLVREMRIHETLKHRNILQLFGGETRQSVTVGPTVWPTGLYMILDLADGGDLFDKIAPDVGVEEEIAHFYFRQLISGLKYLSKSGICHRDVKPENCLLDGNGNLKVSDFGLATVFKYKGQERLLKDRCGSPPYAAPELAHPAPYAAEPVDVWSAGVLLFALLVGNTPWDEPTQNSPEFCAFVDKSLLGMDPWSRIRGGALDTLLRMLELDPNRRIKLKDLERLDWVSQPNSLLDSQTGLCKNGAEVFRRMADRLRASGFVGSPGEEYEEMMQASQQQQEAGESGMTATQALLSQRGLDPNASFRGSMQLYSRLSMAPTQATNPNLSRFFSTSPVPGLISALQAALQSLSLPNEVVTVSSPSTSGRDRLGTLYARLRVKTQDKRGMKMEFAIHVSNSFLPDDPNGMRMRSASQVAGPGNAMGKSQLSQSTMQVDAGSDSDDDDKSVRPDDAGQHGYDVTLWKKVAEPIELKKVWKQVLSRLPPGMITAT